MVKMKVIRIFLFEFIAVLSFTAEAPAQDKITNGPNRWHYLVEPYLMFPNMKGTVALGRLPETRVDENPSDIFNNLQFGAMLYLEAYDDNWIISSDLIYMDLRDEIAPDLNAISGTAQAKQLAWEIAGLRRFESWLDAGVGLQLNSIQSSIDITVTTPGGPQPRNKSQSKTWVDPSAIVRAKLPLSDKVFTLIRANIGGFGIGSDFAWQLQGYVAYKFSSVFHASIGYRVISTEYDKGSDEDRLLYDIVSFGPVLRIGFNF